MLVLLERSAKGLKVSAAARKTKAAAGVKAKAKAAPKHLHPKTGATWTGHGRAPTWIAEARDRNKFLIASGAEATVATNAGAVSKAKAAVKKAPKAVGAAAHKGQRKGPQPAKYLDPKTGATWSGRGPAPAWLAAAKDRTRFLIGGADAVSSDAGSAKVAGKKASAKKVAAKKTVATKPAAKKDS